MSEISVIKVTVPQAISKVVVTSGSPGAAAAAASAIAAAASQAATAADRIQTGLDSASTAADRTAVHADRVQADADAAATAADRTAVHADRVQADADAAQTAADRVQTGLDRTQTTSDRTQTGQDRTQTGLDRTQTGQDRTATSADRVQTGLDRAQTSADRIQTGQDRTSTTSQAALTAGYAQTVLAQAAAASTYAAAAASVSQQDLSGVTSSFTHGGYSLWAPQDVLVYDTTRDSDGGAWTQRCDHLGWYNENLNGAWLGTNQPVQGIASELVARALGGTLGANVATGLTTTSGWNSNYGASALSLDSNGRLRVTNPVGGGYSSMINASAIPTVVGQMYLVTFDSYGAVGNGAGAGLTAGTTNSGSTSFNIIAQNSAPNAFVFVATATTLYIQLGNTGSFAGGYTTWGNVQVRQVTALAASGSYYPNASDGRFYRLYRNILPNPLDFSQANWAKTNVTPTYNAIANPVDGTVNAALFVDNATNGTHGIVGVPSIVNIPAGGSIYVKAYGNLQRVALGMENGGSAYAYFDINGATAGTSTGNAGVTEVASAISITSLGSGWYKITNGYNGAGSGRLYVYCCQGATNTVTYAGDGLSGFYAYLPHYELSLNSIPGAPEVNSGASQAETFRGNKRSFPRVAGLVLDANGLPYSRLVIYDLTEPGRPMWMVSTGDAVERSFGYALFCANSATPRTLSARNGKIIVAYSRADAAAPYYAGFVEFDFPVGRYYQDRVGVVYNHENFIERRNTASTGFVGSRPTLLSYGGFADITSVSQHVYSDAPLGPDGLPVPTVAFGSYLQGCRVRRHDFSVVNLLTNVGTIENVKFGPRGDLFLAGGGTVAWKMWMFNTMPSASTNTPDFAFGQATVPARPLTDGSSGSVFKIRNMGRLKAFAMAAGGLGFLQYNPMTPAMSAVAYVSQYYSTGWQQGDIRRAYSCDTAVGSMSSAELITNGTFDVDTSGWTGNNANLSVLAGKMRVGNSTTATGYVYQAISTNIGQSYVVTFDAAPVDGFGGIIRVGNSAATAEAGSTSFNTVTGQTFQFTALATTSYVTFMVNSSSVGVRIDFDNISTKAVVSDRSVKSSMLKVFGNLTRTQVGVGSQLTAIGGFGAGNFLQETGYSVDHDYGTGSMAHRAFVSMSASAQTGTIGSASGYYLPLANFAVAQNVPTALNTTDWTKGTGWSTPSASSFSCDGTQTGSTDLRWLVNGYNPTVNRVRKWTVTITALNLNGGSPLLVYGNCGAPFGITAPGTYTILGFSSTTCIIRVPTAGATSSGTLQVDELEDAPIFHRGYSTGASWDLSVNAIGYFIGTVNDGTTKRQVTEASPYPYAINGPYHCPQLSYEPNGTLTLRVNGLIVAQTFGAPLLSLNNASAVLSVGTNYAQTSFFPGNIALLRMGASVPSDDFALWAFQQEEKMFHDGVQVTLPDGGVAVSLGHDAIQDKIKYVTAVNDATFMGLVRTTTTANASNTSNVAVSQEGGIELLYQKTTANVPTLFTTIPPQNLKAELARRGEEQARNQRGVETFDWDGGFVGYTTIGTFRLDAISGGPTIPLGSTYIGAQISGTGVPTGMTLSSLVNGSAQVYTSVAATGTANATPISFTDFILPAGTEARDVFASGSLKREGATKDYTRLYDGFRERVRFAVAPGNTAHVRVNARRISQ